MGWMLKQNKKTKKWRVWTTVSDGWLTPWITEPEVKEFVQHKYRRDYRLKLIELWWTFPHEWSDKDTRQIFFHPEAKEDFLKWNLKIIKNAETYDEEIEKKMKELEISQ